MGSDNSKHLPSPNDGYMSDAEYRAIFKPLSAEECAQRTAENDAQEKRAMESIARRARERAVIAERIDERSGGAGGGAELSGSYKINPIMLWRFSDAPKEFRDLSNHGGDEDWLLLVPPEYIEDDLEWIYANAQFGCCDFSKHPVAGGAVYIGAHA
jgi:hypothetical protein